MDRKHVQAGCDYTEQAMVTMTASQVMQVCRFDLAHSYVNVRHRGDTFIEVRVQAGRF